MSDIVNGLVGLIVGLLSGLFFERRATKLARAHSDELERELAEIRHSVLSMGGSLPVSRALAHGHGDLLTELRQRAQDTQNSEGRVPVAALTTFFLAQGHPLAAIENALQDLCATGQAEEVDSWLVLR